MKKKKKKLDEALEIVGSSALKDSPKKTKLTKEEFTKKYSSSMEKIKNKFFEEITKEALSKLNIKVKR